MNKDSTQVSDEEVTMCDVLQGVQELEDDANAVLGGSDDTNCSYNKGYVSRQALYACKTCCDDGEKAGICLACCYKCHDDHEVVELYTKRNFRCDCGNSKFKGKTCLLKPDKESLNTENTYNQNFVGVYCNCSRPYPDLEDAVSDEMIQCILCEDWYHGRHLNSNVPIDYFEMVCESCMKSHDFLYAYRNSYKDVEDKKNGDCFKTNNLKSECKFSHSDSGITLPNDDLSNSLIKNESPIVDVSIKTEQLDNCDECSTSASCNSDKINAFECVKDEACQSNGLSTSVLIKIEAKDLKEENKCVLKDLQNRTKLKGATFWPENWRKDLCKCSECIDMYFKLKCEFLLNLDDTVHAYEEKGKEKTESQYDRGMSALSQMDRVKQMEAVRAYTTMKGQLNEYLKTFADNKKTVCESDIKEFFEQMSKKQKLNNGVPHFCR